MEVDCHNRGVKVKKKETSCYLGWMKCLPFLSIFLLYRIGVNFTFGLLDCVRYIGDIAVPWIVKPGFCSIHYTVTLAGLKKC